MGQWRARQDLGTHKQPNQKAATNDPGDVRPTLEPGATDMNAQILRDTLSTIALQAVPATTDLWPGISRQLAGRERPSRLRLGLRQARPAFLALAAVGLAVVGLLFVQALLPGQLSTAQAADVARSDPQVVAILRGDIAIVTVTSVVNDVATVVVQDSHGQAVTVTVDLRSRIVTNVYQGPQLSRALTAAALAAVRTDPRTSALLERGATVGRIVPIFVTGEAIDPTTGLSKKSTETWAQVPLALDGQEWMAYVNLPAARIDQLVDPQGGQVPLPQAP
jgi:hypothetical protein